MKKYCFLIGAVVGLGMGTILFSSCSKNELPTPLTSYNMSAYANGELLTFNATLYNYTYGDSNIYIQGLWESNINENYNLNFYISKVLKGYIGTYKLGSSSTATYQAYQNPVITSQYIFQYNADSTHTGSFSITTYDSINKTISGTFGFTGVGGGNLSGYGSYASTINVYNGVFTKIKLSP